MAALLSLVPDTQVTYGSDYPYVPIDVQVKALEGLGLSSAQVRGIESENAIRLLPRLKT
jgi:predicted TIM-barrel fold metal-dependent hydrolase